MVHGLTTIGYIVLHNCIRYFTLIQCTERLLFVYYREGYTSFMFLNILYTIENLVFILTDLLTPPYIH